MVRSLHWSTQKLELLDCRLESCTGRRGESEYGARPVRRHRDDSFQDAKDHSLWPVLGLRSLFEGNAARSTRACVPRTIGRRRSRRRQESRWQLRVSPDQPWRSGTTRAMQLRILRTADETTSKLSGHASLVILRRATSKSQLGIF